MITLVPDSVRVDADDNATFQLNVKTDTKNYTATHLLIDTFLLDMLTCDDEDIARDTLEQLRIVARSVKRLTT